MLKYDTLDIPVKNCRKLKYFQSLGYDITEELIKVKISDLNPGSRILVDAICDYCNSENRIYYKEYKRNISIGGKYACCKECGSLKAKETNLDKWGVENPMCLIEIQEKTKKTNLDKWGVEYPQQSKYIREKTKISLLNKWGVDNISKTKESRLRSHKWMKSDEFKLKSKSTLFKKYNVDNPSRSNIIRDKIKNTISNFSKEDWSRITSKIKKTKLERWGDENYNNIEKVKEFFTNLTNVERLDILNKSRATKLERWGDENYNNPNKIRETISQFTTDRWSYIIDNRKRTNLERWGDENYNNAEKIKKFFTNLTREEKFKILNKSKITKLERWGDENYNNIEKIKESLKQFSKEDWINISNKRKSTNFDRWGVDSISKNEKYRGLNFEIAKNQNYIRYIDSCTSLFSCEIGHQFEIRTDNFYSRLYGNIPLCTICNPIGDSRSVKEEQLYEYIKLIYNKEVIKSYRDVLEIDIYLPELKIGFEFNGLYWHSEEWKEKNYHLHKTNHFRERGIRIIHIWEDDWVSKRTIIESQIKNWLGLTSNKIFGRKTEVREVPIKTSSKFLDNNHIQGKDISNIKLGLYYKNELVSLMTFNKSEGRKKMSENEWNLSRFCSKLNTNVIGGSSKILQFFIEKYNPVRIISYADRDWSCGDLYLNLGFKLISENKPDYKYIVDSKRVHKSRYKKSRLNTKLTESQYMKKSKIYRIWDCGKIKFEYLNRT
jgi:hypothetical protein